MKLVSMTYYVGAHDEVVEILTRLGISRSSTWREVEGRLSRGDPREGSHVWPGLNSVTQVVVDDRLAERLLDTIEEFNRAAPEDRGIDAFSVDVSRTVAVGGK